jgi:hypothetical protein
MNATLGVGFALRANPFPNDFETSERVRNTAGAFFRRLGQRPPRIETPPVSQNGPDRLEFGRRWSTAGDEAQPTIRIRKAEIAKNFESADGAATRHGASAQALIHNPAMLDRIARRGSRLPGRRL